MVLRARGSPLYQSRSSRSSSGPGIDVRRWADRPVPVRSCLERRLVAATHVADEPAQLQPHQDPDDLVDAHPERGRDAIGEGGFDDAGQDPELGVVEAQPLGGLGRKDLYAEVAQQILGVADQGGPLADQLPVSYTHLTLPTSDLV